MSTTGRIGSVILGATLAASLSACSAPISDSPLAVSAAPRPEASKPGVDPSPRTSTPSHESEDGIRQFIPDNATVRMEKRGDLDGDGRADALIVLQQTTQDESAPRRLLLLRGTANGAFEKVIDNPNAILCPTCGGTMGDPLADIVLEPSSFAIVFEGGSRELWSRRYTFAYSKQDENWHLERIDEKMADRINGHQEEKQTTRDQIGSVSIKDFDAALMAQESES